MSAPTPEQMRTLGDRAQQWSDRAGIKHKPGQTLAEFAAALRAAADEVDRLRTVIENAPHAPKCVQYAAAWQTIGEPCTCWKADVL